MVRRLVQEEQVGRLQKQAGELGAGLLAAAQEGYGTREVIFAEGGRATLRVLAYWSDGSSEDVTPLCRYQTNDESIADIDGDGVVTSKGRGDTHVVAFYDKGVAVAPV